MSTECKAAAILLDATYKAMGLSDVQRKVMSSAPGPISKLRHHGETAVGLREPRCPKCHGPMNLLRDTRGNYGVKSRRIGAWLCDNPKCPGVEVVEP